MSEINAIVAIAQNGAIGKDNKLLWHLREDMLYFKQTTMHYPVIMGRKTWESLPKKPLPKRENIVISGQKDLKIEGAQVFSDIKEMIAYCAEFEKSFIIGGASIYKTLMPYCNYLYITRIFANFEADCFFPEIETNLWHLESQSQRKTDPENGLEYCFEIYKRIK
jgi:Dihydrofolate reductase